MRIVITGATGNVGIALVRALEADERVDAIVAIARRRPVGDDRSAGPSVSGKVTWCSLDVSRDQLDVVDGADAVVHLAWKIQPQHDPAELAETNITGTERVLAAVLAHRVPALVCASSVGTYAPGPKDRAVDESWPADGIPTSIYSCHKAAVERMLRDAEAGGRADGVRIVRMRTSLVFQRAAASEIGRLFVGPLLPRRLPHLLRRIPDIDRLVLQATHASDIAEAYRLVVFSDEGGAFNVAADGLLTPTRIAQLVEGRPMVMPVPLLRAAMRATFAARLQRSEAGWLDMGLQTPVMDCGRIRSLGWRPAHTADDALLELLGGMADGAGTTTPPLHPRRHGALVHD